MKRTPEFVLGLIGSLISLLIAAVSVFLFGFTPSTSALGAAGMISNAIGFVISIVALVMACLVNSKTKGSGIILIIVGIIVFLTNYFQIIPMILMLVSGIMCLSRKVN